MKTVFKVGMKVYDQVCFPDKEGVVVSIDEEWAKLNYPCIKVKFEDETQEFSYTNKGCLCDNYYWIPTLSTSPYTLQGFEQKAPAPTFEEVLVNCDKRYPPNIRADVDYKEIYPTKELSEAAEALRRLLFLRDYYNEGWQPNWDINKVKYIIKRHGNRHFSNIETSENHPSVLYFKSKEIRDKFLEEQKELLEIAKPLL